MGLIPGWQTKIPHATWCGQKQRKQKKLCDQKDYGNISLSIEAKEKQLRILYPAKRSFKNKSEILHV